MSKKRKADEDINQLSSKSPTKKNRSSINTNQNIIENSNVTSTQSHYSPVTSLNKPSSSSLNISNIWNPAESLISSFSSTNSHSDHELSSSYRSDIKIDSNFSTTDNSSLVNNPNLKKLKEEKQNKMKHASSKLSGSTPPMKKATTDEISVLPTLPPSGEQSSKVARMMKKMGYDETRGLGRNSEAPTQLIEESKQKGRRGLGFNYENFDNKSAEWNFDYDPAPVHEEVEWCPPCDFIENPLDIDEMRQWIEIGLKKQVIDDETEFCDEDILTEMLNGKTVFDKLPQKEMEEARARSNAYEIIGQSIFLNRAAVKIANIDSVFGGIFTNPNNPNNQQSLILPDEPFYFADICAGPGGFSEYILWRKKWRAKGFGFTLRGKSDFALHKFLAGPPETFDPYYGVNDMKGDGNIFKSENIDALQNYVNKCTNHNDVHIVMADGGFSVEGQENIQEILSKQLYLCQFLTALSILRPGGNFVCKLFDLFTPFSVGLIYLMYRTFMRISIHKPVTSRPANSERYIICEGLREDIRTTVRTYMYEINALLNQYLVETEKNDVLSIVPMNILKENEKFYEYVRNSNNKLGEIQIRNLRKLHAFANNSSLKDPRQTEIRSQCLELWRLPDEPRQPPKKLYVENVQNDLFEKLDEGTGNRIANIPNLLNNYILDQYKIRSLFDYRCVLALGDPVLLLSCGRGTVYSMELKNRNKSWNLLQNTRFRIELPPYTLLLGEQVSEKFHSDRNNNSRSAIYIIDAYFIANENMLFHHNQRVSFMDRFQKFKLFEKTINKPARTDLVPIRISTPLRLEQMESQFQKLCPSGTLNNIDNEPLIFTNMEVESKPRVSVRGLWLFKFVEYPWTIILNKTKQSKCFYNQTNGKSIENGAPDSSVVATLKSMFENSFYWDFADQIDHVPKSKFISYIQQKNHEMHSQHHVNHHMNRPMNN